MAESDDLDKRLDDINNAVEQIGAATASLLGATHNNEQIAVVTVANQFAFLVAAMVAAQTQIAHEVGRLVALHERDMEAHIKSEAEQLAEVNKKETMKRSFIGKPTF